MPPAFEIGGLLISTSALSFLVFLFVSPWIAGWLGRRYGSAKSRLGRTAEHAIFLGVIGARAGFVVEHFEIYRADPWSALYFWQPGYLLWAGVAVAIVFLGWSISRASSPKVDAAILTTALVPLFVIFIVIMSTYNQFMPADRLRAGSIAPPLELIDINGRTESLAALRGKPVILNFWATWCYACRQEMPLLNNTYSRWKSDGLRIVGVDLGETTPQIKSFLRDTPVTYDIWKDKPGGTPPSATEGYFARTGGVGLPTTIFIDRKGVIQSIRIGELTPASLAAELPSLGLSKKPARQTSQPSAAVSRN